MDFCGKSSRLADIENTMDGGYAVIFSSRGFRIVSVLCSDLGS